MKSGQQDVVNKVKIDCTTGLVYYTAVTTKTEEGEQITQQTGLEEPKNHAVSREGPRKTTTHMHKTKEL